MLSGLSLSPGVEPRFEEVLVSISDGLKKTKSHTAEQQDQVLLATYRYDSVHFPKSLKSGLRQLSLSERIPDLTSLRALNL